MDLPDRKYREYAVLFSIFLIALALRLTTAKYDLLLGADPWYHFKIASILLERGEYPMYEYYSRYPFGSFVSSPPGLYYLPVYLYKIIGFTGISFFRVFQLLPAVAGSLMIFPLYLLTKELYNKKIGFFASFLFVLSPAGIERSLAGFYRGEAFMLFTMLFAFYFFIRSVKENPYYSIPAAVFVFSSGILWRGWPLVLTILTLAAILGVLANYYKNRRSDEIIISYAITCGLGLFLIYLFKIGFYRHEHNLIETGVFVFGFVLLLLVIVSMIILETINRSLKKQALKQWLPAMFLVVALAAAYNFDYIQKFQEQYYKFLNTTKGVALTLVPTYVWRLDISEQQSVSLDYLAGIFSVLIIIAPLGLLFVLREKLSLSKIFSLSFIAILVSLLVFQVRFTFLATPALCLLGAFLLYYLLEQRSWSRYISITVVFLLFSANVYAASNFSSSIEPVVSDDLHEALTWIKQNTSEDSIILSWWDYTGPIVAVADRRTVTHTAPSGIVESTSLALRTSNEGQSLEILESMNEDFVLQDMKIDYLLVDGRMYNLWPKILMFEPYVNRQIIVENRDLSDSMLSRLYSNRDIENFELVFESGDVKIYRPVFNYTRIIEIETKRYNSAGGEMSINIKTKSNELESAILSINILDSKESVIFTKEERIGATSNTDVSFTLPSDIVKGTYVISAELYNKQMEKMHSMDRRFILVN
jgi:dolichyl-diphosphooligosaccharide--protein glycosyltransferase